MASALLRTHAGRKDFRGIGVSELDSVDLSVIIVNYNVAALVGEAVASLQRQQFRAEDGREGHLEVIVVDNASSPADLAVLDELPPDTRQIRNRENRGFAAAINLGIEQACGRYLCLLNPDTVVLEGALDILLRHCARHPEVGAVGPRIWADRDRTLLLPPGDPPTLTFLVGRLIADILPTWSGASDSRWHRDAMAVWRSREPTDVPMLSGACILTRRAVLDRVGGFDSGYFLYYEDTDWCRRVRLAGYRLVYVPEAEIVHYFNQSAQQIVVAAQGHASRSQARFVDIHYGLPGRLVYSAVRALHRRLARRAPVMPPEVIDMGIQTDPPRWRLPDATSGCERVVEIGFDTRLIPSAAAFVRGDEYRFPPAVWARLQPGRYCARMLDTETLKPLGVWSWVKG